MNMQSLQLYPKFVVIGNGWHFQCLSWKARSMYSTNQKHSLVLGLEHILAVVNKNNIMYIGVFGMLARAAQLSEKKD